MYKNIILLTALLTFCILQITNDAYAFLLNCKPVKNCQSNDKPCFLEVPQDDFAVSFVGADIANNPLRSKAVVRLRMCTGIDDVCQSGSQNQGFNWSVVNQITGDVSGGQLSTESGILDTGPYTEIGPHTFFGGSCLFGDEPCKIAWQYCELELPFFSTELKNKKYEKPSEIAPHLIAKDNRHVRAHSLNWR